MDMPQAAPLSYYQCEISARHRLPVVHPLPLRFIPQPNPYIIGATHFFPFSYPLRTVSGPHVEPKSHTRVRFTAEQLEILEQQFEENHYPGRVDREYLSQQLCLTEANVRVWFQNRRARLRRSNKCSDLRVTGQNIKKQSSPLVMPTPLTQSPERKCQLDLNVVSPSHLARPPVPFSPLFSPGCSPSFSRMFKFPPTSDLDRTSAHCYSAAAFPDKGIDDGRCTTYASSHSVSDMKTMESR
ncbi:retina and anterior neural fold homeobox protein 2-like [Liolophura sinensis]|uniref:retina and anterior neural fold homeobox protein 2-like n=1 Tax=Liolophura sinensis TaxID=3198878 RepID=UPI003158EDFA